jgi:hypothetical protein
MTIYAVELARLNDGSIVATEANMGIFYRTREQAQTFIRNIENDPDRWTDEDKQRFCHVVTEVHVSNPVVGRTFDMDWQRLLCAIDDSLDLSAAAGQYRKDIAQRAFAYWVMEYAVAGTNSKAEAMKLARGVVRELGFEAESFINKLDFDKEE